MATKGYTVRLVILFFFLPTMAPKPLLNVENTLGAAYVGFAFCSVMFGIFCAQTVTYFRRYTKDSRLMKSTVAVIWILELLHLLFVFHASYFYTILHYASPLVLLTGKVVWSLVAQQTAATFLGTIVKVCFAERLWKFSGGNVWVITPIGVLIVFQFCLGISYTVKAFQQPTFIQSIVSLNLIASLAFAANAAADLSTALFLAYFLKRFRTGIQSADTLINTVIVYSLNTGAMASFFSILALILYNAHSSSLEFAAVYFVLNKFYGISLLYSLNSRKNRRGRDTDCETGPVCLEGMTEPAEMREYSRGEEVFVGHKPVFVES